MPASKSIGTETWSWVMSQAPSIFCKPVVARSQTSVLRPFFSEPQIRLRLCAYARSSPTVIVRS